MVIDASVALKWHLKEADSGLAEALLPRADLCAPAILVIEAGYVLTRLVRQRMITEATARAVWLDLGEDPLELIDDGALLDDALDLSLRLGAAFYDCLYLALAAATGDVLVTADQRFVRAVQTAPDLAGRVRWLGDQS